MEHLSEKQRVWLDHVAACGKAEVSMKAYAERHSLDLQQFYFWKGQLRKLGVLDAEQNRRTAELASTASAARVLNKNEGKTRIQLANGVSIEAPGDCNVDALAALLKLAVRL